MGWLDPPKQAQRAQPLRQLRPLMPGLQVAGAALAFARGAWLSAVIGLAIIVPFWFILGRVADYLERQAAG